MSARESSGANTAVVVPYVRDRAEQTNFPRSASASTGSANDLDDEFDGISENFGISELIIDLEADIEKQDTTPSVTKSSTAPRPSSPIAETSSDINGTVTNSTNASASNNIRHSQRGDTGDEPVSSRPHANSPSTINSTTSNSTNTRVSSISSRDRDRDKASHQASSSTSSSSTSTSSSKRQHSSTATSRSSDEREDRGLRIKIQKTSKPGKNEHQIVSPDLNPVSSRPPATASSSNTNSNNNDTNLSHSTSTKECGTSTSTHTEPDSIGPCEPGTSVTLEGIVWQETEGGILVVNVTWRGKTYVGTLLDCTKHDWAPQRLCDSPASDIDSKTSKSARTKRIATRNNGIGIDESILVQTTGKLRNGKGRRILNPNDMVASSKRRKNVAAKMPDLDSNSEDTIADVQSAISMPKKSIIGLENDASALGGDLKLAVPDDDADVENHVGDRCPKDTRSEPEDECMTDVRISTDHPEKPNAEPESDSLTTNNEVKAHDQVDESELGNSDAISTGQNNAEIRSDPMNLDNAPEVKSTQTVQTNSSEKAVIVEAARLVPSINVAKSKSRVRDEDPESHANTSSSTDRRSDSRPNDSPSKAASRNSHKSSESSLNNNQPPAPHEEGMKPSGISTGPPPAPHSANYYFNNPYFGSLQFNPFDHFGRVKPPLVGPYGPGSPVAGSPSSLIPRFPVLGGSPPGYGHPPPPPPAPHASPIISPLPGNISFSPHQQPASPLLPGPSPGAGSRNMRIPNHMMPGPSQQSPSQSVVIPPISPVNNSTANSNPSPVLGPRGSLPPQPPLASSTIEDSIRQIARKYPYYK